MYTRMRWWKILSWFQLPTFNTLSNSDSWIGLLKYLYEFWRCHIFYEQTPLTTSLVNELLWGWYLDLNATSASCQRTIWSSENHISKRAHIKHTYELLTCAPSYMILYGFSKNFHKFLLKNTAGRTLLI